jgi:hypothetical protein
MGLAQHWRSRAIVTCPDMVPDAAHRRGSGGRAADLHGQHAQGRRIAPAPFAAAHRPSG